MPQTFQVKRRTSGAPGLPAALVPGELAYNTAGQELSIGDGGGVPQTLVSASRQVELAGAQTVTGVKTIDVNNLKVLGGAPLQFIQTDSFGNLNFAGVAAATDAEMVAATRGDVFGTPLNQMALNGDVVGNLTTVAKTIVPAINELKAQVDLLAIGSIFVGSFDATTGGVVWTLASGGAGSALPAATPANQGWYLICDNAGTVPPAGAPGGMYESSDWLLSDGGQWFHLGFGGISSITASQVTVTPAVNGATNVQVALEGLAANDLLYVLRTGDAMTGNLTSTGSFGPVGFMTRPGLAGPPGGNNFNINWAAAGAELWIDNTNLGAIITGSGTNFVLKTGDTMSGELTLSSGLGASGVLRFGNTGVQYLTFDGANYVLNGGQFIVNSNIYASGGGSIDVNGEAKVGSAGATGILRFGAAGAQYVQYDGVNMNIAGAVAQTWGLNNWGHFAGNGTGAFSGNLVANGNWATQPKDVVTLDFLQSTLGGYAPIGNLGAYVPIAGGVTMTGILYHGSGSYYFNSNGDVNMATGSVAFNLNVTGHSYLNGAATISGSANVVGPLTVSGATTLNAGASVLNGLFYCQQNANISGQLDVYGFSYHHGNLRVEATLTVEHGIGAGGSNIICGGYTNVGDTYTGVIEANPNWGAMSLMVVNLTTIGQAGWRFNVGSTSFDFRNNGGAYKPGGGAWAAISDARIKTVRGDYSNGLAAINALRPVRYTYKGNDTTAAPSHFQLGKEEQVVPNEPLAAPYKNSFHYQSASDGVEHIGLIAQEVEIAMPEIVAQSPGYIDGELVTDLRTLDTSPLVFALINAVKELSAKVTALEAAAGRR